MVMRHATLPHGRIMKDVTFYASMLISLADNFHLHDEYFIDHLIDQSPE